MAGKKSNVDVNRSQAIRDFFQGNPDSKAREVVKGLSNQGIQVSEDLVYAVKRKLGKGRRKQMRRATAERGEQRSDAHSGGRQHARAERQDQ